MNYFVQAISQYVGTARSIAEVAASVPAKTWSAPYCRNPTVRLLLVEPDPSNCVLLREAWGDRPHVRIEETAIGLETGEIRLWRHGKDPNCCTDAWTGHPNIRRRHREWRAATVPVQPFSEIDPGDLDAMMLDVEGCEIDVLCTMTSRPKLIVVEVRSGTKHWEHPCGVEVATWMHGNGYVLRGSHEVDDIYTLAMK